MSENGNMSDANSDIAAAAAAQHARAVREQERAMSDKPPISTPQWEAISTSLAMSERALVEVRALAENGPQGKLRIQRLEERIRELETRPHLYDAGIWNGKADYDVGAVVTHDGSAWVSKTWHRNERPGTGDSWRLLVKRGRDGKDAQGSR